MERPAHCPRCLQKHENIRGVIFAEGRMVGSCENEWHLGSGRQYDQLDLTESDRRFLAAQYIGV